MVVAAEAAGASAGLAAGLIESSRGLRISMERRVPAARSIINTTIFAGVAAHTAAHVVSDTAFTAATIVVVAVVKGIAAGVVAVVVKNYVAAAPAYAPVAPAPPEPAVEADAEAHSPKQRRATIPDSGIGIPAGPCHYGIPVHEPRIISGDVDHIRRSGLNDDVGALRLNGLLRRVLQIACLLRFLAHHLNRVHHPLLLVVVSVAQRRRPGNVLVHISQHGGKRGERFHARIPRLLVHGLAERVALQIGMSLHPAVRLDNFR